jgi:hypothetical protein
MSKLVWYLMAAAVVEAFGSVPAVAQPPAGAIAGWNRFVAAVEHQRAAQRLAATDGRFFEMDFEPHGRETRRAVTAGAIVIDSVELPSVNRHEIATPGATVQRWRGVVYLPGIGLNALLDRLEITPPADEDVLRSAVLSRGEHEMRVYLRLQRRKIVTVVYDTEHDVRFERFNQTRAASTSIATRIVEVRDAGQRTEAEYAPGTDHGFLWKLNAYWRYEQVDGGVIVECESISLSRTVPFLLRPVAGPIVNSIARESLERTLNAIRTYARPS